MFDPYYMSSYNPLIIALYKNPLNKGRLRAATKTASGANITCGDRVRIYLKIKNGKIADASFEGEGCAISTAAASLITEEVKGKTAKEIAKWDCKKIFELLETQLSPVRIKCGLLALETLQSALSA